MRQFDPKKDIFSPEAFEEGSPGAMRAMLKERGYSVTTDLRSLPLRVQTDMMVELINKSYNELNRAEIPEQDKVKIRKELGHFHERASMHLLIAITMDQMGLSAQTNLGEISSQQKEVFVSRLGKHLHDMGAGLPESRRREFAIDVEKATTSLRAGLLEFIHPGGAYLPPPLPLTNVWDFILSCIPFSGCDREYDEKTGTTTYTYRDGSTKVIDKEGNWTTYDKNGNVTGQGTGDTFEGWIQPLVELWDKWGPYIRAASFIIKLAATLGLIPPVLGYLGWSDLAFLVYDGYQAEVDAWKD